MDVDTITDFSHRSKILLTQLEDYEPFDEREQKSLELMRKLLLNSCEDDVFYRQLNEHHITGSAFILSDAGLLLHFHKKIPLWLQPGGHLDDDETPLEAAARETREETGVEAIFEPVVFHVDVHDTPAGHVHYDLRFIGHASDMSLRPPSDESQKVAWFSPGALSSITDPALTGAIRKLVARKFLAG